VRSLDRHEDIRTEPTIEATKGWRSAPGMKRETVLWAEENPATARPTTQIAMGVMATRFRLSLSSQGIVRGSDCIKERKIRPSCAVDFKRRIDDYLNYLPHLDALNRGRHAGTR
jgi:hypothetical protein